MYWLKYTMALEKMKAMQAGTKSKEKNGKFGKVKLHRRDTNSTINPDLSNLRKPIDTSISTLYHISKLLEDSTEEIKSILTYECDIIYECRICRSLFRSIVNLISHKREYCKEKFNITLHKNTWNDLNMISTIESAIDTCQTEQTIMKSNLTNDRILRSQVSKETCKRDLTGVISALIKKQEDMRNNSSNKIKIENVTTDASRNQHIYLKSIATNSCAVYQTIKSPDTVANVDTDLAAKEIMKLQNIMKQNNTTLEHKNYIKNKNQLEKNDSPIQANPSNEGDKLPLDRTLSNSLICAICNANFSTKKTLTFHVKTLHTSQRTCYTCPCCASTFANTWSVHRHLFKVHKKNHEQVRKLRLKIQEVPFSMEAITTQDSKKSRATGTSAAGKIKHTNDLENDDKAQKTFYSKNDVEDSGCNKCGKKFDTKTALSAHSQHCQTLIAACDQVTTKINQPNSSTLSNSVLNNDTLCELNDTDESKANFERMSSSSPEIIGEYRKAATRMQPVSLSTEDWDTLEHYDNHSSKRNSPDHNNVRARIAPSTIHENFDDSEPPILEPIENPQSSNIVHGDTSKTKAVGLEVIRRKGSTLSCRKKKRKITLKRKTLMRVERSDFTAVRPSKMEQNLSMESKMAAISNLQKMQCLLCQRKFTSMTSLRRHMAIHIGWYRYRCKLCDFKCFFKCDCVVHCNKMHNTQNSHAFMAEMVIEIPQSECKRKENIVAMITDIKKIDDPDDADKTMSYSQSEIREDLSGLNDTNTCVTGKNEEAAITGTMKVPTEEYRCKENIVTGMTEVKKKTDYPVDKTASFSQSEMREDLSFLSDTTSTRVAGKNEEITTTGSTTNVPTEKKTDGTATLCTNLEEYMENRALGKLNVHSDLKRMVMEVILGPTDTDSATKQTDSEKSSDISNEAERDTYSNDNENSTAPIDDTGLTYCSITDGSKSQRPMRKRIKPLRKDFIYDLKDIQLRKESCKGTSSFSLGKSSAKHHLCDSETLVNARKKTKLHHRTLNSN
ncbi:zinc finger protein 800 [Odontomachus brunneus]|uniref:zinc finger protein 800 n=1 Tax=Odontomachus brunneus TaxID=486640 RepID=UPI0013F19210|nr:zinc finger protein 800 [Odontomachus brunneus]XP_032682115.1 zinc finger protein 800 [Odontomachus brunneus]XP_032682116.1 zinc finger protein 800 [Odontomachus brunneus]